MLPYPQDAQYIFESMADEACLEVDSDLEVPKVRLMKAGEEGVDNFKSFAHAELDLGGSGGANFGAGQMKVDLDGMTTHLHIGWPICSRTWVGLTCISAFHHLALLPSRLSQIPIS